MKFLINTLIFTALACVLSTEGIYPTDWQYWAVMACVFAFGLVEVVNNLWKEVD